MKSAESVENKLQELINQYNLKGILTVDIIKDLIWREEGDKAFNDFIKKSLHYFKSIKDVNELNSVLQIFNDAWNYFPHQCLNGKSPIQMLEKIENNQPQ